MVILPRRPQQKTWRVDEDSQTFVVLPEHPMGKQSEEGYVETSAIQEVIIAE